MLLAVDETGSILLYIHWGERTTLDGHRFPLESYNDYVVGTE